MRIGIYVRVSTPNQVQNQTIEQQVDRMRLHLAEQGEELAAERIFRDDGYSPHCARPLGAILDYRQESRNSGESHC
jgi:DNA invertase Pin-like site-specific DNA recombinase